MILGELIDLLAAVPAEEWIVDHGFGAPHSWRGSYDEVSFEPVNDTNVGAMLDHARSALGATFTGWKGGEFTMDKWTPVHINYPGEWSDDDLLTASLLDLMLGAGPTWDRWPRECVGCGETRRGYHYCEASEAVENATVKAR